MLFITGTSTGVGKTHFSALLLRALRDAGLRSAGFKPICCGDRADAEILTAASDPALTLNECNPVWMRPPVAPWTACLMEGRQIDLDLIRDQFHQLRARFPWVIVEGVGGWRVPIRRDYFVSDLAVEMQLPVLVVAANQLGMLNHTLLTVAAVQSSGLPCAGIVLNTISATEDAATTTNRSVLEDLLAASGVPILGELPHAAPELAPGLLEKIRAMPLIAGRGT